MPVYDFLPATAGRGRKSAKAKAHHRASSLWQHRLRLLRERPLTGLLAGASPPGKILRIDDENQDVGKILGKG